MIAQGATAALYLQTRNSREQRQADTTVNQNNNNGRAKDLNPKRSHQATHRPNGEYFKASRRQGGAAQESLFGDKASDHLSPPTISFSWPHWSPESLPWPDWDWKAQTQRSVKWIRSVDWKLDWLKELSLEEEALSASKTLRSEWVKVRDSLEMPRIPLSGWLGLGDNVQEGTVMPPPPLPPRQHRRR